MPGRDKEVKRPDHRPIAAADGLKCRARDGIR
jgi:hypothetical protein